MDFRILGPLQVEDEGRPVALGGPKQRALLALLLLHANEVVPRDRLIDDLWGDRVPETAATALQGYVSGLRKAVGPERILTRAPGYLLRVDPDAVDLCRFDRLVREGRAAVAGGNAQGASEKLSEALALWRGPPLADVTSVPFAYAEALRLEELRLAALEERLDAELALGRHSNVVAELETLVARHPLRERLRGQLMVALYRCGRQAEALEVYQDARRLLVGELGIEPGPALRGLEQGILNQDPVLEAPPLGIATAKAPPPRRRRGLAVLGVILLALGTAAVATIYLSQRETAPVVVPNSLVEIDSRTNEIVGVFEIGRDPGEIVVVGPYVFVADQKEQTLSRLDRDSGEVTTSGSFAAGGALAQAGKRHVWVSSESLAEVVRINAESLLVVDRLRLPRDLAYAFLAVGGGSLWVSQAGPASVSRWRLRTLTRQRSYELPLFEFPVQITVGQGAAWIGLATARKLLRIETDTGAASEIDIGGVPSDPAVAFGSVWTAMLHEGTVKRVDPLTGQVVAIVRAGRTPWGLAPSTDALWVSNHCSGTVMRIDPETSEVVATIETGLFPKYVAASGDRVWVGVVGAAASDFTDARSPDCE